MYIRLLSVRAVPIKQKLNYEIKIGQCNPHLKNCAVYLPCRNYIGGLYIFTASHPYSQSDKSGLYGAEE